ncbi:DUF47 family protein [Lactiplantibacillus garii]|uniref:DUF47 family protein n=1 Tax=Lactiplantibacillus garii TaxID=2306423 RepID=A0A3R8J7I5_9LACO|nr:DUF47 family protein [Lactiplantibacillus garii]RRK10337.1 DUF47 family protein [Lactiplantibacillus garii]
MLRKKSFDFFKAMEHLSTNALQASTVLDEIITNFDADELPQKSTTMHQIEDAGDDDIKKIMHELYVSFITPIDREDIVQLVDKLDNIIDGMDGLTYEFAYLHIHEMRPNTNQFIKLICDAVASVDQAVKEFSHYKNSKTLDQNIENANKIESLGDDLYTKNLSLLFAEETDPIEVIRWQKVYAGFEKVLDACEDCADIITGLVIKNS